jgi:amino acid transporter/nucleotide-binding universal stress UspA family protein
MSDSSPTPPSGSLAGRLRRPIEVIVVSSVMFTFISYWRTAAVVLCDLASTAYYIGGIAESAIGACAPWFILAVMLFSYAVRSIYIESCSLFVRGGVYRVVKEAMGGFLAKLSVSALMFDYVLTGPISGMSAGQYIMGLIVDSLAIINPHLALSHDVSELIRRWGAVTIASLITLYFFRQNLVGIHESSGKALKIVIAATVMAVVVLAWCGATLIVKGPVNQVPLTPDLRPKFEHASVQGVNRATGEKQELWQRDPATGELVPKTIVDRQGKPHAVPKINEATGNQEDPLGFIPRLFPSLAERLRQPGNWWSIVGLIGILIAFGHSILAMSGEETLAQVYREVESPKLRNFKKAALIVFAYSLVLTTSISFLAVLLIPDEIRMKVYGDNLIGGLAMNVIGPPVARLALNAFVVVIGFLILAGAVNTAMIGSNGVLNRVAEDGVLPDWVLKPHRRYGTTHRLLYLIVTLQLMTIIASRGDMYVLGEAYAFGVVWSFVFKALAMVVLRFKDRSPREFKVPLNLRIRGVELPLGLIAVFLLLLATAVLNFLTKEVASVAGMAFTAVFLTTFILSERYHEKKRGAAAHQHLEQFNRRRTEEFDPALLRLSKPYRKLVAIRSTQNLFMLEKALLETDPLTTDVIVMTAKKLQPGNMTVGEHDLDQYDRELMTAVVNRAESIGKEVKPLILPTNNPLFAVVNTAKLLGVQELVLGTSNMFVADDQLEQIAFYWMNVCEGTTEPLTVRLLSTRRDVYLDLGGGNRIPRISERQARSVEELRSAGVGVSRALLVHPGTAEGSDLFKAVLTMLDSRVAMSVVSLSPQKTVGGDEHSWAEEDIERAMQLRREVERQALPEGDPTEAVLSLARSEKYDVVILGAPSRFSRAGESLNVERLVKEAPCWVCVVTPTAIPADVDDGQLHR